MASNAPGLIAALLAAAAVTVPSTGCGPAGPQDPTVAAAAAPEPPVLTEAFVTDAVPGANLDSLAVWRPSSGPAEVLVTAKEGNVLVVFDALTGRYVRSIGGTGDGLGQFRRPNGIVIDRDLALVVERDNARVQVLAMPGDRSIGTFGAGTLRRPYGIAVHSGTDGWTSVYVTDNYETADEQIPPDAELGQRVHQFRIRRSGEGIDAVHVRAFGDTSGPGVLRKVETIGVDPAHNRLLVAEEHEAIREIKVYTLDGRFTGQIIPNALFKYEPEGLALYACGAQDGFWIATDQHPEENVFHVLDRRTLALRGSFRGARTRQTDGIALTQGTLGPLTGGGLYASHADAHMSGFAWSAIAAAAKIDSGGCW